MTTEADQSDLVTSQGMWAASHQKLQEVKKMFLSQSLESEYGPASIWI